MIQFIKNFFGIGWKVIEQADHPVIIDGKCGGVHITTVEKHEKTGRIRRKDHIQQHFKN